MSTQANCQTCGEKVEMTFDGQCIDCRYPDYDQGDDACYECGGEGFISDCFEEWACVDPEGGCDLCTRRCDACRIVTPQTAGG
jgi:hypothetical protein